MDWSSVLRVVDYGDAICSHGQWERSRQAIYDRVHAVASRGIVPVVLGGVRSAAVQVIATTTLGAIFADSGPRFQERFERAVRAPQAFRCRRACALTQ